MTNIDWAYLKDCRPCAIVALFFAMIYYTFVAQCFAEIFNIPRWVVLLSIGIVCGIAIALYNIP